MENYIVYGLVGVILAYALVYQPIMIVKAAMRKVKGE